MDETANPWTTIERRQVYDNNWISVREDSVLRPDGKPGIYGVVQFKSVATAVLAVTENDEIYLVGQFRYPLGLYSWELPEGGAPFHEDPLAAAQRELLEETGLTAEHWEQMGVAHLSNSVSDEKGIWYLATKLKAGTATPEGTERLSVKTVSFQTALDMVFRGEITDSLSVMAIQQYALRRLQCKAAV
jgi:8-oxo-dGTP pyrophosphatase MutT (NUDIX family)